MDGIFGGDGGAVEAVRGGRARISSRADNSEMAGIMGGRSGGVVTSPRSGKATAGASMAMHRGHGNLIMHPVGGYDKTEVGIAGKVGSGAPDARAMDEYEERMAAAAAFSRRSNTAGAPFATESEEKKSEYTARGVAPSRGSSEDMSAIMGGRGFSDGPGARRGEREVSAKVGSTPFVSDRPLGVRGEADADAYAEASAIAARNRSRFTGSRPW